MKNIFSLKAKDYFRSFSEIFEVSGLADQFIPSLGLLQVGALKIIRKKYFKKRQEKGNSGKIIFKYTFLPWRFSS